MSVVQEPDLRPGDTIATPRLWLHTLLVCLILAVIGVASGWSGSIINSDEAATLSQAEIVRTTGAWGIINPAASIDPEGRWFAIDRSERVDGRFYPYTKHILYPTIVGRLGDIGGLRLVLAMQGVAVGLAAGLAGLMMRRVGPSTTRTVAQINRLSVLTVWVVALGSPLAFDSSWVIAHGYGALAGAFAASGAVAVVLETPARRGRMAWAMGSLIAGCVAGVLLRSEGVLWGLALATALGFSGLSRRHRPALLGAILAGAATIAAYRFDTAIARAAQGSADAFVIEDSVPWLAGRFPGFVNSFLRTTYGDDATGSILPGVAAICTAAAWFLAARLRATTSAVERRAALLLGFLAAGAWLSYLAWQVAAGYSTMPGLLIASPVIMAAAASGTVHLDRSRRSIGRVLELTREQPGGAVLCAAWLMLVAATIATQYAAGGSMDWGGRYLHLGLPAALVVCILGLSNLLASAPPPGLRPLVALLAISTISVTLSGVVVSLGQHAESRSTVDVVAARINAEPSAREPGGAIVVTSNPALGRALWPQALTQRWLSIVDRADAYDAGSAMAPTVNSFLLIISPSERDGLVEAFAPWFRPSGQSSLLRSMEFVPMERIRS